MKTPMNNDQIMAELRGDTPLNRARAAFSGAWGALDQAGRQRRPPGAIEIRGMEFAAAENIVEAAGFAILKDEKDINRVLHTLIDFSRANGINFDSVLEWVWKERIADILDIGPDRRQHAGTSEVPDDAATPVPTLG